MLSEAEAWREIALRVDKLTSHDGYLCDQVGYLSGRYRAPVSPFDYGPPCIDKATDTRMVARIDTYIGDSAWGAYADSENYGHQAPQLGKFRKARVLAALWLALDAEHDAKRLRAHPTEKTR